MIYFGVCGWLVLKISNVLVFFTSTVLGWQENYVNGSVPQGTCFFFSICVNRPFKVRARLGPWWINENGMAPDGPAGYSVYHFYSSFPCVLKRLYAGAPLQICVFNVFNCKTNSYHLISNVCRSCICQHPVQFDAETYENQTRWVFNQNRARFPSAASKNYFL